MREIIINILNLTAWRMSAPKLFGSFHIFASLAAAGLAVLLAAAVSKRKDIDKARVLAVTGWVLVILEIWKQFFLYYIVNNGAYDWWYFPFQLCSVPMYLCILLPLVKGRTRKTFLTFLGGYTFVSAVATLVFPEDILRSYTALTVHGFVWHGILLFISLVVLLSGLADTSAGGLMRAFGLFALLCVIAVLINIAAEPVMLTTAGISHKWAAMFYLNPYHISPQPIISGIQKTAGIPAGLIIYAVTIAIVSSLFTKLLTVHSNHKAYTLAR